jgi:hypothetical protein
MAFNTTLSPTIIAKEALRLLRNNLVMGSLVYRDYEAEFPGNPKKGGSVTIRKPVKFTVTKARTRTSSVITEHSITLTVSTQAHVSWQFEMVQLTLTVEEYSDRYLRPACAALANQVDADLCGLYKDIYNEVYESTGFVTPATYAVVGKAQQKLDEEACPPDGRVVVLNPAAHWSLANTLAALYAQEPATKALRKGFLGRIANAEFYMDQNIKVHTFGGWYDTASVTSGMDHVHVGLTGGTGNMNATAAAALCTSAKSIVMIDYLGGGTAARTECFLPGDTFSVSNVYAVNPMSGESTGALRQFVITATVAGLVTGTSSGNAITVSFEPAMVNTGPYKTVSTIPANNATAAIWHVPNGQTVQNLCFHKDAFALVMVPLEAPKDEWGATMTDEGFSIRVVKQYSIDSDSEICRLDILYGIKTIYPELAVRICGKETTV